MDHHTTAILLVSFGTSYLDSKEKTIDKIMGKISEAFPNCRLYQAWTSKMLLKILKERYHLAIPSVEEAMAEIISDGIKTLIVQPTHFIHGVENDTMINTIQKHVPDTMNVFFGSPLLCSPRDQKKALQTILSDFSHLSQKEALVLMGHGTTHYDNFIYAALNDMLKEMGYANFFLGTMEAYPDLSVLLQKMQNKGIQKVHLAPFMLVAGKHAHQDMAGTSQRSWKSLFEKAGYEVICHFKGLGEYDSIQELYLEHLRAAFDQAYKDI
ncbi:MAG: sirohydrochlorin cobaltochelatase [Lachnospiraceae bacterium]|nr:sirohydrochlorin cobaltochelatase [Lachnospiraceae bacterium]